MKRYELTHIKALAAMVCVLGALAASCSRGGGAEKIDDIPSVLFPGTLWAFEDDGSVIDFADNPSISSVRAIVHQSDDKNGSFKKGDIEVKSGVLLNTELTSDFIHLASGDASFWAQKNQVAVNALQAVTVMDCVALRGSGESVKIEAEQLVALFNDESSEGCRIFVPEYGEALSVSSRDFVSAEKIDIKCVAMMAVAKSQKNDEDKKDLYTQALSLDPCQALKDRIEAALKALEKPRSSFLRLSIPPLKNSGRYGVNMSEIMKGLNDNGVTEDPFMR